MRADGNTMGVLDGKVAIVTGAGKGLGKYEAFALAREGAAVMCVSRVGVCGQW